MSIKNFGGIVHIGTYNDHHKEATFHVPPGTNTADLIRAFMSDKAEDVPFSSVSPESYSGSSFTAPRESAEFSFSHFPHSSAISLHSKVLLLQHF